MTDLDDNVLSGLLCPQWAQARAVVHLILPLKRDTQRESSAELQEVGVPVGPTDMVLPYPRSNTVKEDRGTRDLSVSDVTLPARVKESIDR